MYCVLLLADCTLEILLTTEQYFVHVGKGKMEQLQTAKESLEDDESPYPWSLPEGAILLIFSFNSDKEFATVLSITCKSIYMLGITFDEAMWKFRCDRLWKDKDKTIVREMCKRAPMKTYRGKYLHTLRDSRRTNLREDELCNYRWAFRFKESAGEFWTSMDPYWSSHRKTCMERCFQSRDIGVPIIYNPGKPDPLDVFKDENNMTIKWRLTKSRRGSDGVIRRGTFLKLNNWPSSGIERGHNWCWIIQNQWAAYVFPSSNLAGLHEYLERDVDRWL